MSTKIALALAFHQKDYQQTLDLAKWIVEITDKETCRPFLLVYPRSMGKEPENELRIILGNNFSLYFANPIFEPSGWPQGPNAMFDCAARWMQETGLAPAWLWLEPDCLPTKPAWITDLESEYDLGGKRFMGNRISDKNINGAHMNGIAIYPRELSRYAPAYFNQVDVPFDITGSDQSLHDMYDCIGIQHCWKPAPFTAKTFFKELLPTTVLFHQCKDGTALKHLRRVCKLQTV